MTIDMRTCESCGDPAVTVNHWRAARPFDKSTLSRAVCAEHERFVRSAFRRSPEAFLWDRYLAILHFKPCSDLHCALEAAFLELAGLRSRHVEAAYVAANRGDCRPSGRFASWR